MLEIASQPSNDISVIQRIFGNEVEDIIRAAANNAYISGINYVAGLKQLNHKTYITTPDIATIKKLTAEFEQIFWRRVAAVLHQKDIISSILSARFSTKSKLSLSNIVSGFVVRLVTKSIALGSLSKSKAFANRAERQYSLYSGAVDDSATTADDTTGDQEVSDEVDFYKNLSDQARKRQNQLLLQQLYQQLALNIDDQEKAQELQQQILDLGGSVDGGTNIDQNEATDLQPITQEPGVDIFEWATEEDERVCPVCQSLDGQQWSINDPDMPEPGTETHDNCRCRLDLVS